MRKFFEVTARAIVPANVILEVTYRCNLKCIHCYVVDRKRNELQLNEYAAILDQLAELGTLVVTVTGGEPLVRRDIRELLSMISDRGFALRLFTAGFYVDASFVDFLADLNILEVEMSIYGSNAFSHDYVTKVPGSFEKLKAAVGLLVGKDIKTNLKFVAMKHNYREVLDVKKLAEELGANFYYDTILTPRDDLSPDPLRIRLNYEEMREFYSLLRGKDWNFGEVDLNEYICNAGISTMAISPYGEVFPCVQLRLMAGNVREEPVKDIWMNSDVFGFLRKRRLKDYLCGGCPLVRYCAPCIGAIWLEKGSVDGCTDALRNRARILKELSGEE